MKGPCSIPVLALWRHDMIDMYIFGIIGPARGKATDHRWIPLAKGQ